MYNNCFLKLHVPYSIQDPDHDDFTTYNVEQDNDRPPRHILPQLDVTADELIATQLSLKLKTNASDKHFYRSVSLFKRLIPTKPWEKNIPGLPPSLYKAKRELENLCNVQPKYIIWCPRCLTTVSESTNKERHAECLNCPEELFPPDLLAKGYCNFATIPIRRQIELFTKKKSFRETVTEFKKMPESHMNGKLHQGLVTDGQFDLSLTLDGSQLHRNQGKMSLPLGLLFNNVPVSMQLRFPVLAALFIGDKQYSPHRFIFLKKMMQEIRELAENPIVWTDSEGNQVISKCYVTCSITDTVEQCLLMNHLGHNAFYACHFCYIRGLTITFADHEECWRHKRQKIKGKSGKTLPGGPRFIEFVHSTKLKWRTAKDRRRDGGVIDEDGNLTQQFQDNLPPEEDENENPPTQEEMDEDEIYEESFAPRPPEPSEEDEPPRKPVYGVKGPPVIDNLPKFHITNSHVGDTLHVILHGILRDLLKTMMDGHKGDHTLGQSERDPYKIFDVDIRNTTTRCSEVERKCRKLEDFPSRWTAYDERQFLLHNVALFCSDKELFSPKVYQVLIHLANIVYLSHYGRMTSQIIKQVKQEIAFFCEGVKTEFTVEYMTYKFHVLQHFPKFLKYHGNASWTDGFNMEKLNLNIRNLNSAQNQELAGVVRNFILLHHSSVMENVDKYSDAVQEILQDNGVETSLYKMRLQTSVKDVHPKNKTPSYVTQSVLDVLENESVCTREHARKNMVRLKSIRRNTMFLQVSSHKKKKNSSVRDCYVMVNGNKFGKIKEIIAVPDAQDAGKKHFVIVLKEFKRQIVMHSTGEVIQYPINQFPYREFPGEASNFHTFLLKRDTFLQKGMIGETTYKRFNQRVKIISFGANEYYRN